jgi:hypothetical protein
MRKMNMKNFLLIFCIFFIGLAVWSQAPKGESGLKRQFRNVQLLEAFEGVMEKLKADTLVLVDPSSDFGDFDEDPVDLIKAKIPPYIQHIYYQFYQQKLFLIALFFDKERFSYVSLYHTLKQKYGAPQLYNAENAVWEDAKTRIVLDALPSLKYMDKEVFQTLKARKEEKRRYFPEDSVKEKILEDL